MMVDWTVKAIEPEFEWLGKLCGLKFAFTPLIGIHPFFQVKIPVQEKAYKMNCEDYAKRLVGNAFSVPVVQDLLRPLQTLFVSRKYAGYDYEFPWTARKD
jgi:hypothetical protein